MECLETTAFVLSLSDIQLTIQVVVRTGDDNNTKISPIIMNPRNLLHLQDSLNTIYMWGRGAGQNDMQIMVHSNK